MRRVVDHLSVAELERRFVGCADPVEARHVQVIWLLAQGHTVGATSRVTAFGTCWIEQLLERYNASGLWSAKGEAAVRTVVATARMTSGADTFSTMLGTIGA